MENMNLRIARELNRIARELVATGDYDYIYDPEHKKHPGGGYQKTEKGWQKGKQDKGSKENTSLNKFQKSLVNEANSNWDVRKLHAAEHRQTPTESLDKLSSDANEIIRQAVAKNPSTSVATLDKLADDKDFDTKINVARNPNTSPQTLDKLAQSNEGATGMEIKIEVVLNDNTSSETLDKLAKDDNYYVRLNVAAHPNTSVNTLKKLAKDKHFNVRYSAVKNPNTPIETVRDVAKKDKDATVKNAANKALLKREFDITKLSPELREKVKDWDAEDIGKFLAWLKEHKG